MLAVQIIIYSIIHWQTQKNMAILGRRLCQKTQSVGADELVITLSVSSQFVQKLCYHLKTSNLALDKLKKKTHRNFLLAQTVWKYVWTVWK